VGSYKEELRAQHLERVGNCKEIVKSVASRVCCKLQRKLKP